MLSVMRYLEERLRYNKTNERGGSWVGENTRLSRYMRESPNLQILHTRQGLDDFSERFRSYSS
jgi:hypothetical protein